jgi:hypothetical protein
MKQNISRQVSFQTSQDPTIEVYFIVYPAMTK